MTKVDGSTICLLTKAAFVSLDNIRFAASAPMSRIGTFIADMGSICKKALPVSP